MGKSHTNASSVTLHPLMQAHWGHIQKLTVEKSSTATTSVIMHLFCKQLEDTFDTVEKGQTNVTSAIMHPLRQAI